MKHRQTDDISPHNVRHEVLGGAVAGPVASAGADLPLTPARSRTLSPCSLHVVIVGLFVIDEQKRRTK